MRSIKVSPAVAEVLSAKRQGSETPNDTLRRLLSLPPAAPPRGDLLPLIRAGKLRAGDIVTWNRPRLGQLHTATVDDHGGLTDAEGNRFRQLHALTSSICGYPANSWSVWRTSDDISLRQLRDAVQPAPADGDH